MIQRKVSHNFILFLQNDDNHFFKMMAIIIQRNVTQNFIQLLQNDDKRKKLYINRIFFTSIVIKLYLYLDVTSWKAEKLQSEGRMNEEWWMMIDGWIRNDEGWRMTDERSFPHRSKTISFLWSYLCLLLELFSCKCVAEC